jgi:Peptidase M15
MYISRITNGWRRVALSLAAVASTMVSGLTATAARADDLPFWERADAVANQEKVAKIATKKTYSKKVASKKSPKSYASKKAPKQYASKSTKKLGGYAEATEPVKKKKSKGVKVAALGNTYIPDEPKAKKSLTGGGVNWVASSGCLDSSLKAVIYQVAANYGPLRVNSTCRSKGHNRSVGGASKSKHLSGDAADFRVFGNVGAVYAYLKSSGSVGGLKHYGGGLFHIDNGDRRSW